MEWSFSGFISRADVVGLCVLFVLLVMSIASWYQIIVKGARHFRMRSRSKVFLASFHRAHQAVDATRLLVATGAGNPFARVLSAGFNACHLLQGRKAHSVDSGFVLGAPDDYVSAALAHGVADELSQFESGQTVLASIAASAPFVGLFGTVWGIFHALERISVTGEAGLDSVAGPVGEALIMTACGLLVAIPAVLAYNAFTRLNRRFLGDLERFGHAVFGLLGLGVQGVTVADIEETDARGAH